ncbi:hypothetical protein [Halorarum salinum]|uniref:Uncharacterized protein n=1 Tax=Halorarum salinum TaxID=2743089 RepID=A0A7D5LBT9_9EURY|nr:hypothetical protein [Halobaculum salinum]QLG62811.1 hypothetical protein HUG12_14180 [Halobaculum salinum]
MSQATTRKERKAVYEAVLRVVDAQTSPEQAPGIRRTTITRLLTPPEGPHDLDDVRSAIRAARENDELLSWPDHAGRRRYSLADVEKLRRVAEWEGEREHPRPAVVGWANRMVAEVSD